MATMRDSYHFIPRDNLLRIDGETTFQEVYKQLHQAEQGGFLLVDEGKVQTYVRAYDLADAVVQGVVKKISRITAYTQEVRDEVLAREMKDISNTPIKKVIDKVISQIVVPIDIDPVDVGDDENPLQNQDHRVFNIYEDGESIGWYLNHETLRDTTTAKPVFVCSVGHENPDTDHGTCYSCWRPISDTK